MDGALKSFLFSGLIIDNPDKEPYVVINYVVVSSQRMFGPVRAQFSSLLLPFYACEEEASFLAGRWFFPAKRIGWYKPYVGIGRDLVY